MNLCGLIGALCGVLLLEYVRLWRRVAPLRDEAESARHEAEMARIGRDSERRLRERAERQAYQLLAHRDELWRAAVAYLVAFDADVPDDPDDPRDERYDDHIARLDHACDEAREALRRATQGDRP